MTGTLHIFLRSVVNGSSHYQVNFNTPGYTFAKVFQDPDELQDLLTEIGGLSAGEIEDLWHELDVRHSATLSDVEIEADEASLLGLMRAPVE